MVEQPGAVALDALGSGIVFEGVTLRYPSQEEPALREVSLAIRPGETLALVGASGGGKSTTANMLPRFYTPVEGEILLDGVDLNELTLSNLRSHVALVGQ